MWGCAIWLCWKGDNRLCMRKPCRPQSRTSSSADTDAVSTPVKEKDLEQEAAPIIGRLEGRRLQRRYAGMTFADEKPCFSCLFRQLARLCRYQYRAP